MNKRFKNPNTKTQTKQFGAPVICAIAVGAGGKSEDNPDGDEEVDEDTKAALVKTLATVEQLAKTMGEDHETIKALTENVNSISAELAQKNWEAVTNLVKNQNDLMTKLATEMEKNREDQEDAAKTGSLKKRSELLEAAKEINAGLFEAPLVAGGKAKKIQGGAASVSIKSSIHTKAPEIFGQDRTFEDGTDTTVFTGRVIDPILYQKRRKGNLIFELFNITSIEAPALVYLEKIEKGALPDQENAGGAEWIKRGAQKPMRSFRLKATTVTAKKLAIFGTIEDELLRDVPSMEVWLREDFQEQMREKANDGLLNNVSNPDAPIGLKANVSAFEATPAFEDKIVDANYIDVLLAAFAWMRYNNEYPEVAVVAADVRYAIIALKDRNARYQNSTEVYQDRLGNLYIGGVLIWDADQEDVSSEEFMVLAQDVGFKIREYQSMVFEAGLNGEDFRYDRTSYRAYREFLTYMPADRINTVIYDTFANALAQITAPETPAAE